MLRPFSLAILYFTNPTLRLGDADSTTTVTLAGRGANVGAERLAYASVLPSAPNTFVQLRVPAAFFSGTFEIQNVHADFLPNSDRRRRIPDRIRRQRRFRRR